MNPGALAFMLGAWVVVLGLAGWSYYRLLKAPKDESLPPPGSIP